MTNDSFGHTPADHSADEMSAGNAAQKLTPTPGPAARRGMTGRRLAAVATGTTLALGAGGIAYATTGDPTAPTDSAASPTEAPTESPAPLPDDDAAVPDDREDGPSWSHGGHGPAGLPFGVGMALHGEQVVETEDGSYETIATQRGVIDELSADEVTVTSEDGFSRTYELADEVSGTDPGTTDEDERLPDPVDADLAVGDEVLVVARVDGSTATVLQLRSVDVAHEWGVLPDGSHHGPWGEPDDDPAEGTPS